MDKKVLALICGVAGIVIGSVATYIYEEKKYEKIINEDLKDYRKTLAEVVYDMKKIKDNDEAKNQKDSEADIPKEVTEAQKTYSGESDQDLSKLTDRLTSLYAKTDRPSVNYSQFYKKVNGEIKVNKVGWETTALVNGIDYEEPYAITEDEFYDNANQDDWKRTNLSFYLGDNVLLNEHDIPIEDSEDLLGPEFWTMIGTDPEEPELGWFRNPNTHTLYEVIAYDDFFYHPGDEYKSVEAELASQEHPRDDDEEDNIIIEE